MVRFPSSSICCVALCLVFPLGSAAMLTGRYPWGTGFYTMNEDSDHCTTNSTALPELLKPLGYKTHALGKWYHHYQYRHHRFLCVYVVWYADILLYTTIFTSYIHRFWSHCVYLIRTWRLQCSLFFQQLCKLYHHVHNQYFETSIFNVVSGMLVT